jgi:hypothetical protein
MTSTTNISTFPSDLGISTRVGLTRGVGMPDGHLSGFVGAEADYRQQVRIAQAQQRAARRTARQAQREARHNGHQGLRGENKEAGAREVLSRWTAWLSSDPRPASSPAPQSCSVSRS